MIWRLQNAAGSGDCTPKLLDKRVLGPNSDLSGLTENTDAKKVETSIGQTLREVFSIYLFKILYFFQHSLAIIHPDDVSPGRKSCYVQ